MDKKIILITSLLSILNSSIVTAQFNLNGKKTFSRINQFSFKTHNLSPDLFINHSANFSDLADKYSSGPHLSIFDGFGKNIVNSFKGDNIYLHLAGVASTYLIISNNIDYKVQKFFNENDRFGSAARPVIRIANYFPFIIGGSLFVYSKIKPDTKAEGAAYAVLQATLTSFLYNSLLKALTGRPHPDWVNNNDMRDLSKTFRFGFMRGGIFWGWPSGHTSSTMAVVSALTNFYPEKTWLKIAGYSYVAYMIFAVSSLNKGGMHWFSDAVAAAFMSYAIGSTAGKYFRDRFINSSESKTINSKLIPPVPILEMRLSF